MSPRRATSGGLIDRSRSVRSRRSERRSPASRAKATFPIACVSVLRVTLRCALQPPECCQISS